MFILKSKQINFNKKNFKYVSKGDGELVLLVHGWPETLYSWRHQIDMISNLGFKVVAFNVRGYADSYSPKKISDYTMKKLVQDILDIIAVFNKKSAILIGHDWGAPICWNTAALNKKIIKAVIGLSVPYTKRGKISSLTLWRNLYKYKFFYQNYFQIKNKPEMELEKNLYETLLKIYYWCSAEGFKDGVKTSNDLKSGLLEGLVMPEEKLKWLTECDIQYSVKEFLKSGFKGSLNRYRAQDLDWKELPELNDLNITQPCIFIAGEYDPVRYFIKGYDAYENTGRYCIDFRGAYIIPNAGHWIQQEKPKEVNKTIKNFLVNL